MTVIIDPTTGYSGPAGVPIPVAQGGTGSATGFSNIVQSMIRLNTANGYGSTNTVIRRWTNVVTNQGSDITYADSATLGGTFTINNAGVYAIGYNDQFSGFNWFGISLSSNQLTTVVTNITAANRLSVTITPASDYGAHTSWTGYLLAGAIIRAHTNGGASGASVVAEQFTITRVS
jgi:hypothetical protein